MNDRYSNFVVAGFYRTAFAVSALIISASFAYAADPPAPRGNVSVTVNPTTGYYSTSNTTLRLPDGVRATPLAGATTVTKYAGGLQQTMPTGITIDAIKKSAPLPVVVRANTQSVKNAAKGFLSSPRSNLAFLAASTGLQALLDTVDWVMTEGASVKKRIDGSGVGYVDPPPDYKTKITSPPNSFARNCNVPPDSVVVSCSFDRESHGVKYYSLYACSASQNTYPLTGTSFGSFPDPLTCYYGGSSAPLEPIVSFETVQQSEINSTVDSLYNPEPSDWPALTPHLELNDVEITSAPTLKGEPITTTVYDADGVPHEITETNTWYDFDIRDNPSSSPSLDLKTREETKTYKDGALTGTTTTETTQPSVGGGGGSNVEIPTVEIPTDCDFHPTLCKWLDWTKEEPTEPDLDLKPLLQTTNIEMKSFVFSASDAGCPAPIALDLSFLGSREVSYQPLCDLASTMKPLYLALMAFLSALLISRSINRV